MRTLTIELYPRETECCVCGGWCDGRYGVPMYEGDMVPSSWTGEQGGLGSPPIRGAACASVSTDRLWLTW